MSNSNRVFITGTSALTASGNSIDTTWDAILAGQSNIAEIKQWDVSTWETRLGGELRDFKPAKMLPDRKLVKMISRQDAMGINAATQAVEQSQIIAYRDTLDTVEKFNDDTAVFVGSPGNKYLQQYDFLPLIAKTKGDMKAFSEQLFREVHPMWLLRILPNNVLAYAGITYGFKGMNQNVTNHAVSGTQALIEAYHAIKTGRAERAVVVAYDVGPEPQALFYYDKLGVVSPRHLKPFDAAHDGTILAEGAAAIVLESEASVAARGAKTYSEMVGGASATEAEGLFSIDASGDKLASLMSSTLDTFQVKTEDIGLMVAHANGNPKSDISEAQAIDKTFGAGQVPVTAFKWAMGHTLCASGILDTVLAVRAAAEQRIPGIANLEQQAASCANLDVSSQTREATRDKPYTMLVNRGFSSMNACLVIRHCE